MDTNYLEPYFSCAGTVFDFVWFAFRSASETEHVTSTAWYLPTYLGSLVKIIIYTFYFHKHM